MAFCCRLYKVLNILEFNSTRQNMLIIGRDKDGKLWLLFEGPNNYSCFCCGNHHQHFLNNKPKASLLGASLDYLDDALGLAVMAVMLAQAICSSPSAHEVIVHYNNLEALLLFPLELLIMGRRLSMRCEESDWYEIQVVLPVGSLVVKLFLQRGLLFLGLFNKLLTVVINLAVRDKHATFVGTLGLLTCMFGGGYASAVYHQETKC
ncbi:unnamed protein product [Brassica oleracea var. botrytis]